MENIETRQDLYRLDEQLIRLVETDSQGKFVDSYLLLGRERALLIDTQRCAGSLYEKVCSLTDKPLEIVITHAHYDHFGPNILDFLNADIPVWIFKEELDLYRPLGRASLPNRCREDFPLHFLSEGQIFDLGGIQLRVYSLTGHTPRSAMLLEENRGWLFSGDALGNRSFYMQVAGASSLEDFTVQAEAFFAIIKHIPTLSIFTGHGIGKSHFDRQWAQNVLAAAKDIINGTVSGYPADSPWPDTLRLDTPVFPEGFFYRNTNIRKQNAMRR